MTREALLHTPDEGQRQPGFVHARLHSAAAALSDADLLSRVVLPARAEREATVELVAHLAELDARRLYPGQGYGSLNLATAGLLAPHLRPEDFCARREVARRARERQASRLDGATFGRPGPGDSSLAFDDR
jgi:hypothetical protein